MTADEIDDDAWVDELARRAGAAVRVPAPAGGVEALERRKERRRTAIVAAGAGAVAVLVGAVVVLGGDGAERPAPPVAIPVVELPATTTGLPATTTSVANPAVGGALATLPTTPSAEPVPVRRPDRTFALLPSSPDAEVVTPTAFEFTPDGEALLAMASQTFIRIDAATGAELRRFGEPVQGQGYESSPDGSRVFHDTTLWDATTGRELMVVPSDRIATDVRVAVFSPDSTLLAVATACAVPDGCATVYDARDGTERYTVVGTPDVFTPDSAQLLSHAGGVTFWDAATGASLRTLELEGDTSLRHVVVGDGRSLLSASAVAIYDLATGRRLFTPTDGEVPWASLVSPGGELALSLLGPVEAGDPAIFVRSGRTGVWDTRTGQLVAPMDASFPTMFEAMAFSPDGSLLLASVGGSPGSSPGEAQLGLWSTATGQLVDLLGGLHPQAIARFSPDGARVLAWGGFNEFWEWNLA